MHPLIELCAKVCKDIADAHHANMMKQTPGSESAKMLADMSMAAKSCELEIRALQQSEIGAVAFDGSDIPMLGGTYETQGGLRVRMVAINNIGTPYETLVDESGINRYSRRISDMGRATGSAHDYSAPENLKRPIRALALDRIAAPAAAPDGLADTIVAAIIKDIRDRKGLGDEWENIDVDVRNEIAREWKGIVAAAQGERK